MLGFGEGDDGEHARVSVGTSSILDECDYYNEMFGGGFQYFCFS